MPSCKRFFSSFFIVTVDIWEIGNMTFEIAVCFCCSFLAVNCQTSLTQKKMTVTPKISINDGNLVVHGKTILKGVHDNIILTPGSGVGLVTGAFIGATASESKCLHVFPIGVLE